MTEFRPTLLRLAIIMSSIFFIAACSIDSSTELNDEVDQLIEEQRAVDAGLDATAEQQATAPASSSTSAATSSGATPVASSSAPTSVGGGFVWKPVSESNGNLVVLLPPSLRGRVSGVAITKGGAVLERGHFAGDANGGRPHYRFSMPGAAYGTGLTVVASLTSGGTQSWSIPNGGQRIG